MDTIIFDYVEFPTERRMPRPVANLTFEHEGTKTSFYALIDSGADYSISYREIGLALGMKFNEEDLTKISGVETETPAYRRPIAVLIGSHKIHLDVFWLAKPFDTGNDFPFIIGRTPFFDKFDITFQQTKRKFYFKPV